MDQAPKEMFVGVINPYALTEASHYRKKIRLERCKILPDP